MKKTLIFIFLLSLFGLTTAQESNKPPVRLIKIHTMEGITEYRMNNGLKVLLFPDPSKDIITVNLTYLVGSRHENYGETGMAHLLEHLVFKGSPKHKDIPAELSEHGADANGTTWFDRTNYYETFPATKENLEWALDLEADRMVNSFIAKEDLESEFSVVRSEFERGENNPFLVLYKKLHSVAYDWHNYGKSTIGNKSDVENVPIDRLKAFYKKYYQPDNSVLVITGKFDEEETLALVKEKFGVIPRPKRKLEKEYTVEPVQDGEKSFVIKREGGSKYVGILYHTPNGYHKDFFSLALFDYLMNDEPSGRLYKALVDTKKASRVFGFDSQFKHPGNVLFFAELLKEGNENEVAEIMFKEIENIASTPITEAELERAKGKLLKQIELYLSDTAKVGTYISEFIAMGDWRLLFYSRDLLKGITVDDVNNAVKQYLVRSNSTMGKFIPTSDAVRAKIPEPESPQKLLKDYKNTTVVQQGEVFDASYENLAKRVHFMEEQGLNFAFLSKKTRGEIVHGRFTFKLGNLEVLSNKGYAPNYLGAMLTKGTASKSRQEIDDLLTKYKAELSVSYSTGSLSVRLKTKKEHLNDLLVLVEDVLKNSNFPESEFDKLKVEDVTDIERNKKEPQAIAITNLRKSLSDYSKGHPKYVYGFEEEVEAINKATVKELKDFYKAIMGASNAHFSLVGDFDEEPVKQSLVNAYSDWKSPTTFKYVKSKEKDTAETYNEQFNTPDKKNAFFFGGVTFNMLDSSEDYIALRVANYLLGGGFISSRLASRLRQKDGLCYAVGSGLSVDSIDDVSIVYMYGIFNPDNLEKFEQGFKEEIDKVVKDGFTEEELTKAKSGLAEQEKVDNNNDAKLVGLINRYSYINRRFDWNIEKSAELENLSLEAVNKTFNKYISNDKIHAFKAGDFEREKEIKDSDSEE